MVNMGPGMAGGWYRYSPPPSHPPSHPTPGTPPHCRRRSEHCCTMPRGLNLVVGLISVAQLSLDVQFSDFRGITEGYNLVEVGNPNGHNDIPGNK